MNYYQPRQVEASAAREDAGKWRYTCRNDNQIWAVGYCAEGCPGHDTPEEARQHQREYELDRAAFKQGQDVDEALSRWQCGVCDVLTTSWAMVGPGMSSMIHLCVEHLDREGLMQAWDGPGDVISS